MRRTLTTSLTSSLTLVALAAPVRLAAAAPASETTPPPPMSVPNIPPPPALDAAYGTPPAGATYTSDTHGDPGYVERQGGAVADRPYGSTAKTYAPDGTLVEGLQLYDDPLAGDDGFVHQNTGFHVVRDGDTLWGISGYYLSDPYLWPKVWSWNEQLTNPHWIYPGDRIRLGEQGQGDAVEGTVAAAPGVRFSRTQLPKQATPPSYLLNQVAYVDADQLDGSMKVTGGADSKAMMSTLDTVYMSYDKKSPPIPGERLVVYAPQRPVYDAKGKKVLGYVVQVMGEVEVGGLSKKAAEGTVMNAFNPIERGYRVGPLRRQFRRIEQRDAGHEAHGTIVSTLTTTGPVPIGMKRRKKIRQARENVLLVGEEQFVVTDLGSSDGVEVGHVLEVVRRGDAYMPKRAFKLPYKEGWPRRVIGAILVVDVEPETSLGVVVYAQQEIERGERIELGGGKGEDDLADAGGAGRVEGQAAAGDGRARASGALTVGGR